VFPYFKINKEEIIKAAFEEYFRTKAFFTQPTLELLFKT